MTIKWLSINDVKLFEIELSNYCNAKCPACAREININNINNKHLSLDQIKLLVKQIPDKTKIKFYFGGTTGDPLMNPDIVDIVRFVADAGIKIALDTNASLRNVKVWKSLGEISKNSRTDITFSIDGLHDTNHIYRINTKWDKIMRNLKAYISAGGQAEWKYIIFEHNKHQVNEAKQLAKELGVVRFISEPSSRVKTVLVPLNKTREYNGIVNLIDINCRSLNKNYIYISSYFEMYPCCYFHARQDAPEDIVCDLNLMSLEIALNNMKYQNLVDSWITKKCPETCKIYCNQNKYWDKILTSEKL